MTTTATKTYTLCLYCGYDTKVEEHFALSHPEKLQRDFYNERNDIDEIMRGIGSGAEYLGSMGRQTTWEISAESMGDVIEQIQAYNSIRDFDHIIHIELF